MNDSREERPGGAPRPALAALLVRAWPVALATLVALPALAAPAGLPAVAELPALAVSIEMPRGAGAAGIAGTPAADAAGARAAIAAPAATIPAAAATISAADYRRRLIEIRGHLGRGDWDAARRQALRLAGQRVAFGRDAADELEPDLSVLRPLANARDRAAASKAALPLARLIGALPHGPEAAPAAGADAALLERLRRSQELAEIAAGGSLPDPGVGGDGVLDAVRSFLRPPARLLASLWDGFRDWLERWLRRLLEGARGRRPAFGLRGVVFLAALLALAMLAAVVQAARRRQRRHRPAAVTATPMTGPAQDDDPLSRASGQWESYARDLAAQGRCREAIRAWYHAVLVTLYQRGIVHYRKGRTNWEYLAAIPPATTWRPALVEMTRHFEREWYGRDRSS
ncbi:MAG TPA: DUF4129 domain-containing protein, partial [Thermoanaerobaculia bacterium]|nr:DUF4129 domain-containing protein [Thermoanaerobaculia bacterium]